jgi:hypothetical protein
LEDYFDREKARMPAMDLSDVAYDAFLANGAPEVRLEAEAGERVLLRVVNAGASTYFHLGSAAGPLEIVSADGQRVEPVMVRRLLMGMAETYGVVVEMPAGGEAVEILASAHDGSGSASIVLGAGEVRRAEAPPKPELYGMDEMLAAGLESLDAERGLRAAEAERPFAPYALLRARESSAIAAAGEAGNVRSMTMRLTGDMQRYLWGFDGKSLSEESVIFVRAGEVLRIELINDTMMHHPIHLHGHFFRLLNGAGEFAPLKHTVDVPPMGTRVIEWIADEEAADWFFHCHMLYHMDAGMARVFSYEGQEAGHGVSLDPAMLNPSYVFLGGTLESHMSMGRAMLMRGRDDYGVAWDVGLGDHREREVDLYWSRYLSADWSTVLGYRFAEDGEARDRAFVGMRHRLPYFIHTALTLDSDGEVRVSLKKDLRLTSHFSVFADVEYDTLTEEEWSVGGRWVLSKRFGLVLGQHSDHGFGGGLTFQF